jgi:hypothetical protein
MYVGMEEEARVPCLEGGQVGEERLQRKGSVRRARGLGALAGAASRNRHRSSGPDLMFIVLHGSWRQGSGCGRGRRW